VSPQTSNAIATFFSGSVLSRIAQGKTDPETQTWVFAALFVLFLLLVLTIIWRMLLIERKQRKLHRELTEVQTVVSGMSGELEDVERKLEGERQ
jgi:F0F1-type ATP synthase membrane subunit b/b'